VNDDDDTLFRRSAIVAAAVLLCALSPRAAEKKVRIIQTNSAGDNGTRDRSGDEQGRRVIEGLK